MNPATLRKLFAHVVLSEKEYRRWVLKRLYELQTPNEQARQCTQDRNGAGFTAPDAQILSQLAGKLAGDGTLTKAEETILKWKLPKYRRQLVETRLIDPPDRRPPSHTITETIAKKESA